MELDRFERKNRKLFKRIFCNHHSNNMTIQIGGTQQPFEVSRTCPFLGLADDAQTPLAFPSDWNSCHYCKPVNSIKLDHQRMYCLSPSYKECIVYTQPMGNPLPRKIRNRQPDRTQADLWFGRIALALALLALIIVLAFLFSDQTHSFPPLGFLEAQALPSASLNLQPVFTSTLEPALSPTLVVRYPTSTSTKAPTLFINEQILTTPPSAQPTVTITRIPRGIETLIGINYIFKIHRLGYGESLETLADLNGTTVAAIFGVNYNFSTPLQLQQVIILPINQTDVSDMPPFEAYRLTRNVSLEELAIELDADPEQIQFYNGLGTSTQFQQGEWIIVPREIE